MLLTVPIDIGPGSDRNPIDLKAGASYLSPFSRRGPLAPTRHRTRFRTQTTGLKIGETQACLTGKLKNETRIQRCDRVQIR